MDVDKILKSDGGTYDSDGNVISPPSELGRIIFEATEPRIGKIMKRDGSVVENDGSGGGGGSSGKIEVVEDTDTSYILKITNPDGTVIITPNLKNTNEHIGFY